MSTYLTIPDGTCLQQKPHPPQWLSQDTCLQCEESRAAIKAEGITVCGIIDGYEYRELVREWAQHHWRDWSDKELHTMDIKPEFYDLHRRAPESYFQYAPCQYQNSGHKPATSDDMQELWGTAKGDCIKCGTTAEDIHQEAQGTTP